MGKLIFLSIFSLLTYALVPENFLQVDTLVIEKILLQEKLSNKNFKFNDQIDHFEVIKNDPLNRISPTFHITPFFASRVKFWFNIYTKYSSSQTVIHDKKNLGIVYESLNFEELKKSFINIYSKSAMQTKLTLDRVKQIRRALVLLSKGNESPLLNQSILKILQEAKVDIPTNVSIKKQFFLTLSDQLRIQTGQKTNIQQGLKNIIPFKKTIDRYFTLFKVPKELLSIPFLESSFNPKARSKVNASGVWQFMPFIGRYFLKMDKNQDGRGNPLLATLGALHLLKQNIRIVKRWDLAITAYNSGTKHILKARRQLKMPKMTLTDLIRKYKHPHIGFASENFYSEFIALVYALAYKEKFFNLSTTQELLVVPDQINLYLNLCPLKISSFLKKNNKESPDLYYLNLHFHKKSLKKTFSRGNLIYSDIPLNKKKFWKIPEKKLRVLYPKNYAKLIRKKKCSR